MGEWRIGSRTIAEPEGLSISARQALDGAEVALDLRLRTLGWQEDDRRIDIVPRAADAELGLAGGNVRLGKLAAVPTTITLPEHGWNGVATFVTTLSSAQLRLIECARGGLPMSLSGSFWAEVYVNGAREQIVTCLQHTFPIDRDAWLATLKNVALFESIAVEVPLHLSLPPDLSEARKHLERANEARQRGGRGHLDAVAECRNALNAIEQADFASRAPEDVIAFINKNARNLSMAERTAALHSVLKLYFSPAHHAGSGADEMTHLDSSFALASTAALLQLVARSRSSAEE